MVEKTICEVCSGKGGWKKYDKDRPYDNWQDCLFCEGYGFYDKQLPPKKEHRLLIQANHYRKLLGDALEPYGKIISINILNTKPMKFEINIVASDNGWLDFAKALLKFSSYHNRLDIHLHQVYWYEKTDGKYHFYWKLILEPEIPKELDGLISLVNYRTGKTKEKDNGKGKN